MPAVPSQDRTNYTPKENIIDIDSILITEIQVKNDLTAFTRLMNKYKKVIFNFCLRYTGNREDAEDAAQEVFIKLYKNINSFRGDSKFSTWLYRLTVNTCLNYLRWRKTKRAEEMIGIHNDDTDEEMSSLEIKDPADDPEKILINKELGEVIRKSIFKLKKRQKTVLILKDFMGKSYEEISAIMEINIGTVKSTLSRGRLNVANQIKEYYKR